MGEYRWPTRSSATLAPWAEGVNENAPAQRTAGDRCDRGKIATHEETEETGEVFFERDYMPS